MKLYLRLKLGRNKLSKGKKKGSKDKIQSVKERYDGHTEGTIRTRISKADLTSKMWYV